MGKSYDSEESIRFIENLYDQIESYLTKAAPLESDYHRYVNNETFVGKAAEASKRFIRDKQLQFHYEQQNIQNKLYNMYGAIQGEFEDAVDASPKARIDTDVLKGIKRDVENFYDALNYGGRCIEDEAAYVQEKADEFSDIYQFTFTQPDYDPARRSYEELCGDGEYIDTCIKDFERFDENAWNYVNRSGLEEYVNELTADINAKAAGLDQMEVYKPEMEDTLVKVIGMGGPKAIKETNIHDVFRSYDGKEKLQRMEQGAKILSALGDYIEPKLKELGHKAIKLEPNNAIFLRATSMGMYTFFELAGGVQSYLETGSFSDAEKNAKINYKAFQRGGLNCAVETVTGFLKLPELGIKIGKGIGGTIEGGVGYIKENGTDNLPDDFAAWAGDKGKQVVTLYNILKDEVTNKVNTMSVEEGYESAGYLLTTIGTMVVGGEFGEASKGGEVAKGAEVAGEATETVINSFDDIERVADKIDDVERVVDKLDDVEKVIDKADDVAKAAEKADDVANAFEKFNPQKATRPQKGNFGEYTAHENITKDAEVLEKGYKLDSIGRKVPEGLDDKLQKGIDDLLENKNVESDIKYVIDEAKYGKGQLGMTKSGKQMSEPWLFGKGDDIHKSRIYDSLVKGGMSEEEAFLKAKDIRNAYRHGQVDSVLSKVDKTGKVTTKKLDKAGNIIDDWP